jgi:hypothetical protein
MRIFAFDPADHRDRYEDQGYVHIRGGIDPEFLQHLQEFARRSLEETRLEGFAIKGKKEQSLFDFPGDVDYPDEIFDAIAALCGLDREGMTLSERHIQAYDDDADPEPAAHKDRFPSQVSVGFAIDIPADSQLVLYPHDERQLNPFNTSAGLRESLQPHELPEVALRDARAVEIDDAAGDVVAFPGSTTWHLRRRSAGAVNLYVKLNDFDCDPLGEDPRTPGRRDRSLALLGESGDEGLDERVPRLSRRFDTVDRRTTRPGREVLLGSVFGERTFPLTTTQLELLRAVDGRSRAGELIAAVSTDGAVERARLREELGLLVRNGALDLVG